MALNDKLKTNKLSLNINKCKHDMSYTNEKVNSLELSMDNITMERPYKFNFLGLTLNENINWKSHINKISNKISKSMSILNKLKHFLPLKAKTLIYNSLILSHLNFFILARGYQCERIVKLQKKIV